MANEIIIYQPDKKSSRLEVRIENETVWLTQTQMSELFLTSRNNITLHIGNIFKEKELTESSVCKESLLTASDGKRYKTNHYNLDVIISVGYRVKSLRGTQFRVWANNVLLMLAKRGSNVSVSVYSGKIDKQLRLDVEKHNQQYPKIELHAFAKSHDRFLIIDQTTVFHIGASLKDLGKKWFAFSKIGIDAEYLIDKLK